MRVLGARAPNFEDIVTARPPGAGGNQRGVETFLVPFLLGGRAPLFLPVWAGGSRTGNCHTDRGGRACTDRKTQNCRRFWPSLLSSRLQSVYSHRDPGGRGRETQNCRRFCSRLLPSHLRNAPPFCLHAFAFPLEFCFSRLLFKVWALGL